MDSSGKHRVLVTGSAGAIGQIACRALKQRGHAVRGLDVEPTPGVPDAVVGDLADGQAVLRAADGVDTIVHLGAYPNDADFADVLLRPNVLGLYHVMDTARQLHARRVVLASSLQVISGHGLNRTVRVEDGPMPTNHYALTKLLAEQFGEMYARVHNLSVLAVRVGWLPRNEDDAQRIARDERTRSVYFSHDDAARFFTLSVEHDRPRAGHFEVVFSASRPVEGMDPPLDPEPARRVLGYEGQDVFPQGMPFSPVT